MKSLRCNFPICVAAFAIVFGVSQLESGAGLIVSLEAPGVQVTPVLAATTETFDSGAPSTAIGTYTNMLVLSPTLFSGVYGGAFGTEYAAAYDGLAALELNSPQKYFGMWWAAADPDNELFFFDGATFLGGYTLADFSGFIGPGYFGNPNNAENVLEPYFYANFTATGDSHITHVLFQNGSESFFETDNHSVFDLPITPPGTFVVPEPSGLAALALMVGSVTLRRRSRSGRAC